MIAVGIAELLHFLHSKELMGMVLSAGSSKISIREIRHKVALRLSNLLLKRRKLS